MKGKIKKRYIALGIIILISIITFIIFLVIKNNKILELDKEISLQTGNTDNIENEIDNNIIESNIEDIPSNIEEKQEVVQNTKSLEEQPKKENTYEKSNTNKTKETVTTPKAVTTQTKEETSNNKETQVNQPPTTTSSNANNNSTTSKVPQTSPEQTIKKITQEEFKKENSKFLTDIKSVNPGLKYVNSKCKGMQVFYPYRKIEIDIAVGQVTFGTIYYYIETFVEGNQEKFKYYIGWEGI